MAAKESQSLQIAVIVFFLLTVLLAVTTYVFWKSHTDAVTANKAKQEEYNNLDGAFRKQQDDVTQLKAWMGFQQTDKIGDPNNPEEEGTIAATFVADMEKYSKGLEDAERNYRNVLELVHKARLDREKELAEALEREKKANLVVKTNEQTYEARLSDAEDQTAKVKDELTEEQTKYAQDRKRMLTQADGLKGELDKARNTLQDKQAEFVKTESKLTAEIVQMKSRIDQLIGELKEREPGETVDPDGRITWVNQGTRTVWLDLGAADYLKRQIQFSVYPAEGNLQEPKAAIEVTRVIDNDRAEARIVQDELADPILPGDYIHSEVWNRGRQDGFALVGFMDVDGDGISDRNMIRELIRSNGGRIDAELTDEGKVEGEVTLSTRYIVLGDPPTEKETNSAFLSGFSRLTGQAAELAIPKISVHKLLSRMGWRTERRTVRLGKYARSTDYETPAVPDKGGESPVEFRSKERPLSAY